MGKQGSFLWLCDDCCRLKAAIDKDLDFKNAEKWCAAAYNIAFPAVRAICNRLASHLVQVPVWSPYLPHVRNVKAIAAASDKSALVTVGTSLMLYSGGAELVTIDHAFPASPAKCAVVAPGGAFAYAHLQSDVLHSR